MPKILVVDDERVMVKGIKFNLENEGYQVAFIGFAPYHNPKIAVAVYVENAGFGATYGVPIGSLMIERYLNGEISPARKGIEERMMTSNTIVTSGVKKH